MLVPLVMGQQAGQPHRVDGFAGIDDYGVIGDCQTAALVARDGSVDWLCLPEFSSPAMFAAILDPERGGHFRIRPRGPFTVSRRYLGHSNVLETRFAAEQGEATLTDCLTMLPHAERPGVLNPQNELLRRVEVHAGTVELEVSYAPRPDFGRQPVRLSARSRRTFVMHHRDLYLVLQSEPPLRLEPERGRVQAALTLRAGECATFSLAFVHHDIGILPSLGDEARERQEQTRRWWETWADSCTYRHEHRDLVVRSALVLKQLQHGLTGATVAAPTTSLPEAVGHGRNWDYRYCWLRDAALTFQAFADLGYLVEGQQFLSWLLHSTRLSWPGLNVLYNVFGEHRLPERELDHLTGYRCSKPVRIGNAAAEQRQLDLYGAVIQTAADHVTRGGTLDADEARLLVGFGRRICRCWQSPDSSIWEIRGAPRHYTYSRMMCWSGLDELLKLAEDGHLRVPRQRFETVRDAIARSVETDGYSARQGSYVQTCDGDEAADASLLLAARHYRDPLHPRMRGTFEYVDRELSRGALVYRYAPASDGMAGSEGIFLMTSFWAVEYLALAGRLDEAEQRFDALAGLANDLGLFSEEADPDSGLALGNFPQAFSHLGLITAALALQDARQARDSGRKAHRAG